MLTLKFYAGADDAPPRLPVRVLSGVSEAALLVDHPPTLQITLADRSVPPFREVLNGAVVEVLEDGVSIAHLNAGPEVLTIPPLFIVDTLSPEQRRRMQGLDPIGPGWRQTREATAAGWKVALERPEVIDTVGGYAALGLTLQKAGYSFGRLATGFGWWLGTWAEAQVSGEFGYADTIRAVILSAEQHWRDQAEKTPGERGAALRAHVFGELTRARYADSLSKPRELRARTAPEFTLNEAAFLGTSTEGLSQALIDEGYTLQKSENASNAWRWRKGEALSDWFNGDDARDRCIAALTAEVFGPRCTCGERVGQPHRSDCGASAFVGDTVQVDQVDPARPLHSQSGEQQGLGVFDSLPGAGWKRHNPRDFRAGGLPCEADRFVQVAGDDGVVSKVRTAGTVYWGDGLDCDNPVRYWREAPSELLRSVEVRVNGTPYEVFAGTLSGRQLYARVGGLSGQMLVAPDGRFVGDSDMVDIEGGELFATTTYRDDTKRPAIVSAEVEDGGLTVGVQAPEGHVVVMLNGIPKAVDPAAVNFVDDLWRVLQLAPASGLKVNKPGQVTRPLPDPNAAYKLEHGDAFESFLCERRLSRAAPVQITVDGSERLLTPGVYERAEIDVLFGCAGWDLTQNGKPVERGASVTVGLGDRFSTDIPF